MGTRQVGPADVRAYVATRLEEGASSGTINRELAALRRAYTLGVDGQKIQRAPKIKALDENNVRTGFFEREQLEAVRRHLREPLRPVVTFAYITGWRVPSEVLPLTWRQVDSKAGTIRLEPGTTKNDEARMFVMTPELRSVLEAHRNATETLQRKTGGSSPTCSIAAGSRSVTSGARGRRRARPPASLGGSRTTSAGPRSATSSALASRGRWR